MSGQHGALYGAFTSFDITDAEAVLILPPSSLRTKAHLINEGADTVYLGDSEEVTDSDGWPLEANERIELTMRRTPVYAICASSDTATVKIIDEGDTEPD